MAEDEEEDGEANGDDKRDDDDEYDDFWGLNTVLNLGRKRENRSMKE